jgi:hypothetical protein
MVQKRALRPKPVFDEALLLAAFAKAGVKPVHARKVWTHQQWQQYYCVNP